MLTHTHTDRRDVNLFSARARVHAKRDLVYIRYIIRQTCGNIYPLPYRVPVCLFFGVSAYIEGHMTRKDVKRSHGKRVGVGQFFPIHISLPSLRVRAKNFGLFRVRVTRGVCDG